IAVCSRPRASVSFTCTPGKRSAYRGRNVDKTLSIVCIVLRALRGPGSRHAILRFRGNAARASIWLDTLPKVMRLCFPGVASKPHKQDGYVALPNGSEVWVGGLDDHDRVEKILGM